MKFDTLFPEQICKVTSESLNCTTLHKAFRKRFPCWYCKIVGAYMQTSIDVTMGFNSALEVPRW